MHDLAYSLAAWRILSDRILFSLQQRRQKRAARDLERVLTLLDHLWIKEFGESYVEALALIANEHEVLASSYSHGGEG